MTDSKAYDPNYNREKHKTNPKRGSASLSAPRMCEKTKVGSLQPFLE